MIEAAEPKHSSQGNPMLNVKFAVVTGEFEGRKVFNNYTLTEKSLWVLKQMLAAIGIKAAGKMDLDPTEMLGKTLTVDLITDEYNGSPRNKIKTHKKAPEEFGLL